MLKFRTKYVEEIIKNGSKPHPKSSQIPRPRVLLSQNTRGSWWLPPRAFCPVSSFIFLLPPGFQIQHSSSMRTVWMDSSWTSFSRSSHSHKQKGWSVYVEYLNWRDKPVDKSQSPIHKVRATAKLLFHWKPVRQYLWELL